MTITNIDKNPNNPKKISVFIDWVFCCTFDKYRIEEIEQQLWKKIKVWTNVSCNEIKDIETFIWKRKYSNSRDREKERIVLVKKILKDSIPNIEFENIWFWVDSNEIIYKHPEKKWWPDLKVKHPLKEFYLEVTWKQWCWKTLRIRPDKIQYYKDNNLNDSRFAHTCDREKEVFFIRIDLNKNYIPSEINVNWTKEEMVIFERDDNNVFSSEEFISKLLKFISINSKK